MSKVLCSLGDPEAEQDLIVNTGSSRETGNEKDGKKEWQRQVMFSPCPFMKMPICYIYWYGENKKDLRWEIAFVDGGGSDGVCNSLYDALHETFKYFLKRA